MLARFRKVYGASPLHLVGHLLAFALILWALLTIFDPEISPQINLAAWLLGGDVGVDLVLFPLYAVLDLGLRRALGARGDRGPRSVLGVPVVNHVRVPAAAAGVLLLVYLPLILDKSHPNYVVDTGRQPPDHAGRWLLVSAVLFAISAVVFAVRAIRARRPASSPDPRPAAPDVPPSAP